MAKAKDKYVKRKTSAAYWRAKAIYDKTPRGKYFRQRASAWKRRVPWHFNFELWWRKWQESGKWEVRGRTAGKYCMCRTGDAGPYSYDNTFIGLHTKNFADGRYSPKRKKRKRK